MNKTTLNSSYKLITVLAIKQYNYTRGVLMNGKLCCFYQNRQTNIKSRSWYFQNGFLCLNHAICV